MVSQLDRYCETVFSMEVFLWRMRVKERDRKQNDEDNRYSLLTIRKDRIILIKIMDKANYVNTFG